MLVKDVLKISATYLQLLSCLETEVLGGAINNPTSSTTEQLNLLTNCLNLTINEIANEYTYLSCEEEITVSNNTFNLSALTKEVINVKRIETIYGTEVDYKIIDSVIKVKSGTYKILYNYSPADVELTSSSICETFNGKISKKVLAYGVCCEYCLITGLFEEAVMWKEQFEQSIQLLLKNKRSINLKQRRWV